MKRYTKQPYVALLPILAVAFVGGVLALTDWRAWWEPLQAVLASPEALREFV